ncbi:MAG: type I 3-dehydroquinate dehydratase [Verrucomicrobiota bacterium]
MTARRSVKAELARPKIVGVIFSVADLSRAMRLRRPPDFFELRLDALALHMGIVKNMIGNLCGPIIITARHPCEGGANALSTRERRALLEDFLPHAAYVDIELQSMRALAAILANARARKIGAIISFHDLRGTPSRARLGKIADAARSLGADVLKIATRTDTPVQRDRLRKFFADAAPSLSLAAMGIGKLGYQTRLEFFRSGSVLNYAHLGCGHIAGQPSLADIRRWTLSVGR